MTTPRLALLCLLLAAACESSADKAMRLRQAALADCLAPDLHRENPASIQVTPEQDAQCDVSKAAYAKFLGGR